MYNQGFKSNSLIVVIYPEVERCIVPLNFLFQYPSSMQVVSHKGATI